METARDQSKNAMGGKKGESDGVSQEKKKNRRSVGILK